MGLLFRKIFGANNENFKTTEEVDKFFEKRWNKFTKDFISNKYIPFLEAYCKSHGHNEFYEQVLKIITYLDKNNIKVCKIITFQRG